MRLVLIAVFILVSTACSIGSHNSDSSSNQSTRTPRLVFSNLSPSIGAATTARAASSVPAAMPPTSATDFELGDVGVTQSFSFQLANHGGADATDIDLTSDNPNVRVSPAHIAILPQSSAGGFAPIITIEVLHGLGPARFGQHDVLPAGRMTFTVAAVAAETSASANMATNILVAAWHAEDLAGELQTSDLNVMETPVGENIVMHSVRWESSLIYTSDLPHTDLDPGVETYTNTTLRIVNTGNVAITVQPRQYQAVISPLGDPIVVPPGTACIVPGFCTYSSDGSGSAESALLEIWSTAMFASPDFGYQRQGVQMVDLITDYRQPPPG